MADIKDKQYSLMKENLENLGKGAKKYQTTPDPQHPLPSNITQARYTAIENELTDRWTKAQDALKLKNEAFDALNVTVKKTDELYDKDVRTIKGIFGIHSESLRDFGVQPEKKRTGRKPKPPTS